MADTTPAALAISQMLKFNCIKHNRAHPATGLVTARHNDAQETLVPTYVGVILHPHTRHRELVDRLSHLGMSISYKHVLELSAVMGNSACQQFHREQGVCSPKMHSNVVTTSAIDNIDHNPSSTTAKVSFHGTAISLFQHPSFTGEGVDRSIAIVGGSRDASSKMVGASCTCTTLAHIRCGLLCVASSSVARTPSSFLIQLQLRMSELGSPVQHRAWQKLRVLWWDVPGCA